LLHTALSPLVQAIAVLAVAVSASWRTWVAYRRTVIKEKERTSRLTLAIAGAGPRERPEIIRACSLLESAAREKLEAMDQPDARASRAGTRSPSSIGIGHDGDG
jgi:hypothetical protein